MQHNLAQRTLQHRFVEFMPDLLENGVIYISMEYGTAIHNCACGCGNQVVTPISPKEWKLLFDGESVTLFPSIGNWRFKCRSHYWIENSKIISARIGGVADVELSKKKGIKRKKKAIWERTRKKN